MFLFVPSRLGFGLSLRLYCWRGLKSSTRSIGLLPTYEEIYSYPGTMSSISQLTLYLSSILIWLDDTVAEWFKALDLNFLEFRYPIHS